MGIEATPMEEIPRLVAAARTTYNGGRTRPLEWRMKQIRAMLRMAEEQKDAMVAALKADLGRPHFEAVAFECMDLKGSAAYYLENLPALLKPTKAPVPFYLMNLSYEIVKDPMGVVLIIAPWNFPIGLCLTPMLGALAAGNAVVVKPSEVSENCSRLLAEIIPKYLDQDAVKVIQGGVRETKLLLEQRFDFIMYTGNSDVGKIVMSAAAKNLTPVCLELGGKSPVYVDESANVELAAKRIAAAKCINSGQLCVAPDYVLVHDKVKEPFLTAVQDAYKRMFGSDPKASKDFGRIINERHVDRVLGLLNESHGGEVICGGVVDKANKYVAPTVVLSPNEASRLMKEEIFAPIMVVKPVTGLDEAVEIINGKETPLAAYCFSESDKVTNDFLARVASGGAAVNDLVVQLANLECPFGGKGHSGVGNYRGKWSIETFTHHRTVAKASTRMDPQAGTRAPYDVKALGMMETLTGPSFARKLKLARQATIVALLAVAAYFTYHHLRLSIAFV